MALRMITFKACVLLKCTELTRSGNLRTSLDGQFSYSKRQMLHPSLLQKFAEGSVMMCAEYTVQGHSIVHDYRKACVSLEWTELTKPGRLRPSLVGQ